MKGFLQVEGDFGTTRLKYLAYATDTDILDHVKSLETSNIFSRFIYFFEKDADRDSFYNLLCHDYTGTSIDERVEYLFHNPRKRISDNVLFSHVDISEDTDVSGFMSQGGFHGNVLFLSYTYEIGMCGYMNWCMKRKDVCIPKSVFARRLLEYHSVHDHEFLWQKLISHMMLKERIETLETTNFVMLRSAFPERSNVVWVLDKCAYEIEKKQGLIRVRSGMKLGRYMQHFDRLVALSDDNVIMNSVCNDTNARTNIELKTGITYTNGKGLCTQNVFESMHRILSGEDAVCICNMQSGIKKSLSLDASVETVLGHVQDSVFASDRFTQMVSRLADKKSRGRTFRVYMGYGCTSRKPESLVGMMWNLCRELAFSEVLVFHEPSSHVIRMSRDGCWKTQIRHKLNTKFHLIIKGVSYIQDVREFQEFRRMLVLRRILEMHGLVFIIMTKNIWTSKLMSLIDDHRGSCFKTGMRFKGSYVIEGLTICTLRAHL